MLVPQKTKVPEILGNTIDYNSDGTTLTMT